MDTARAAFRKAADAALILGVFYPGVTLFTFWCYINLSSAMYAPVPSRMLRNVLWRSL